MGCVGSFAAGGCITMVAHNGPQHASDQRSSQAAVEAEGVCYWYGKQQALRDVSLNVQSGEIFALVGPNGGGKTTFFRLLSTLVPLQSGRIRILDNCVTQQLFAARCVLGVVFQTPSLDRKLTVEENLAQQAALYGLHGADFKSRRDEVLRHLGLESRRRELAETLSGGLRRRLDLARGMLHRPRVLLLDEPSTGLDPGARNDLWQYLRQLRADRGTTIVLTTHLLDEAERADRVAIVDRGSIVCVDRPQALCDTLGGDSILIDTQQPAELAQQIRQRFGAEASVVDQQVRLTARSGRESVDQLMDAFADQIRSIRLGKPTLEDVFIARTGHRFWQDPST